MVAIAALTAASYPRDVVPQMQAHALAFLLRQRNTTDGQPQCYSASHSDNLGVVDLRCKGSDGNNLFSVDFTKVQQQ